MGKCLSKTKNKRIDNVVFTDDIDEARFNDGKPILLESGLRIIKNPQTNKLEGLPEQWATNFQLPLEVDYSRVVKTSNFPKQIKPDQQFPESIMNLLNQKNQISRLSSVLKNNHQVVRPIQIDLQKPYGLKQIPEHLVVTLSTSFNNPNQVSDPKMLAQIISHLDEELKQSKVQKQFVTSQQLEMRIKKVKFVQDNPSKNFIFVEEIGKGGVCKVFKVEARFAPGTYYAVRIMKEKDMEALNRIRRQIAVMEYCNSTNIVQYNFTYYYRDSLFMFIEYMDGGSLTDFIKFHKNNITEEIIAYILKQIVKGLKAVHSKRQIHRDIKSDNILIDRKGRVKIADFGYALQLTADKLKTNELTGTAAWMAPQLVKKQDYDEKVDIWSLGIVIIQLCQGEPPYLQMEPVRAMYKISIEEPPTIKGYSVAMTNFVERCLQKDPKDRATACQLLKHPFLENTNNNFTMQKFTYMISKISS